MQSVHLIVTKFAMATNRVTVKMTRTKEEKDDDEEEEEEEEEEEH